MRHLHTVALNSLATLTALIRFFVQKAPLEIRDEPGSVQAIRSMQIMLICMLAACWKILSSTVLSAQHLLVSSASSSIDCAMVIGEREEMIRKR